MVDFFHLSFLLLSVRTGRVEAGPELSIIIYPVGVREHIVVADRPFDIFLLLQRVNVFRRGRLKESDIIPLGIAVFNCSVQVCESRPSILIAEIIAPWDHKAVGTSDVNHLIQDILAKNGTFFITVERFFGFVYHDGLYTRLNKIIILEFPRSMVVVKHCVGENRHMISE